VLSLILLKFKIISTSDCILVLSFTKGSRPLVVGSAYAQWSDDH